MNYIAVKSYESLSKQAALLIAAQILNKPNSVLGFATGSSPIGTYEELVSMYKQGILDFSKVTTYNLDEYVGSDENDKNGYRYFMNEHLFSKVNVDMDATHVPNGVCEDPTHEGKRYEDMIVGAGGVDIQLLGIGLNGHIGFNEPDTHFPDTTHLVDLTESTIKANARFYANEAEVPRKAITMGVGTIMRARKVILLATKGKEEIIQRSMYGPISPDVPASILQLHPDVTVIEVI